MLVPAVIICLIAIVVTPEKLLEIGRAATLLICAGVAGSHLPIAHRAFGRERPLDEAAVLSLDWLMLTGSVVLWCSWYLLWRSFGAPSLWWDEYLLIFFSYLATTGGILVLMVVRATNGIVPARAWWGLGIQT